MTAGRKKPVGRTPICDPAYQRRIDPVWAIGRVPPRFWQDPWNRRDYMLWLARKLRFRWMQDWYKVTYNALKKNGGSPVDHYWGGSAIRGVLECFPDYDWQEWLFVIPPNGFWSTRGNRLRYLRWLENRLGYRGPEDWYRVRAEDFFSNQGHGCLKAYGHSPSAAAMDLYPAHPWVVWRFPNVPRGFWRKRENIRCYLEWLGRRLGVRRREDWRAVRRADFLSNSGDSLIAIYRSHFNVLSFAWPTVDWNRGRKGRRAVPPGPAPVRGRSGKWRRERLTIAQILRWADAHRRRTGQWPRGKDTTSPDGSATGTWCVVDYALYYGRRGLPGGSSLARLLAAKRGKRNNRAREPLSIEQILAWADGHLQRTGNWPNVRSGRVADDVDETWLDINRALEHGYRGLPGGSSISRLLFAAHGRKPGQQKRPLSIGQVLAWADEHRKRTGRWPSSCSGRVAPGVDETWGRIESAMYYGHRGLPKGGSLARLLAQRRGKKPRLMRGDPKDLPRGRHRGRKRASTRREK